MNACILSIFMQNIDQKTVSYQQRVVSKFNTSNVPHYCVLTGASHGYTMDQLVIMAENKGYDTVMFLDIDCVPLNNEAIPFMLEEANKGILIGDAQRSNHIENNEHVFCAPHNIAFTIETYKKMKNPTFNPSYRGDVAEEVTYAAEENGVPVKFLIPIRYDAPPIRMAWEPIGDPFWKLATGMPNYGVGTTFGVDDKELFWHNYQIFHPGQQERFWNKCKEILGE